MNNCIELRHRLHQVPELMFEEHETTAILLDYISRFPGLIIHRPLETGLLAEYRVNDGPYMLFRADIDALPIVEQTHAAFSSTNRNMHACGHDVHSSILCGFMEYVTGGNIQQNLLFLFQPGEEGGGGAQRIIESGVLEKFNIKYAFALHVTDEYDFGTVASTSGVLFAAAVEVDIDIHGKSSHVAFPDKGIHAFKALSKFLLKADQIIENMKKPVLFGYGKIISGTARNIVPDNARAECTLRTMKVESQKTITDSFIAELELLKSQTGIGYRFKCSHPYTEVTVSPYLYNLFKPALSARFAFTDCGYKMTAEDFGLYSRLYPSFMCWLGTGRTSRSGLHTPLFLPDDDVIQEGIDLFRIILENAINH